MPTVHKSKSKVNILEPDKREAAYTSYYKIKNTRKACAAAAYLMADSLVLHRPTKQRRWVWRVLCWLFDLLAVWLAGCWGVWLACLLLAWLVGWLLAGWSKCSLVIFRRIKKWEHGEQPDTFCSILHGVCPVCPSDITSEQKNKNIFNLVPKHGKFWQFWPDRIQPDEFQHEVSYRHGEHVKPGSSWPGEKPGKTWDILAREKELDAFWHAKRSKKCYFGKHLGSILILVELGNGIGRKTNFFKPFSTWSQNTACFDLFWPDRIQPDEFQHEVTGTEKQRDMKNLVVLDPGKNPKHFHPGEETRWN